MRLYNRTRFNDEILEKLIYAAGKFTGLGVRTSDVVIRVTTSRWEASGLVEQCGVMKYWHKWLKGERVYGVGANDRLVSSDGGYMFLRIPNPVGDQRGWKSSDFAERIYRLAAHEWCHVADQQKGKNFSGYNRRWKNRPHEKRAVTAAKRAIRLIDKPEIQEALKAFAGEIDRLRGVAKKAIKPEEIKKWVLSWREVDASGGVKFCGAVIMAAGIQAACDEFRKEHPEVSMQDWHVKGVI